MAFVHDNKVLIKEAIRGRQIKCGLIGNDLSNLEVSPLEHTGSYTVRADTPVTIPATQWEQGAGIVNEPNNVGNVDDGDWFDYPLSVQDAGVYEITLRVACGNDVGAERGVRIVTQQTGASVVSVPVTGGWQTYQEVSTKVRLVAGQQRLTPTTRAGICPSSP